MLKSLLMSRRFAPLFWCQFFSAFSDNFLKNTLVFLLLFQLGGPNAEALITLAGAIFIAPYFFLSALGGEFADRFDKAVIARRLKLVEIGIALIAVIGFALNAIPVLFVALFLFGVIGALFGPIKYGILPDHLAPAELPAGNALVEGATFMAILLGTIAGGLAAKDGGSAASLSILMIVFSLLCWGASLYIPPTGEAAPQLKVQANIARSTGQLIRHLWSDARLWWGALVTSWFWLVGVIVLSLLPPLIKTVLGGQEEVATGYLAAFSIAVAIGSGAAAWLAAGRIILWPTLLGGVIIGIFAVDLGWQTAGAAATTSSGLEIFTTARGLRTLLDLSGIAIGGGLFIVPAFAAVQFWAGADRRARVVAAVNVLNAAFMTAVTVIVALMQKAGAGPSSLFLGLGIANFLVTAAIAATMPRAGNEDMAGIARRLFSGPRGDVQTVAEDNDVYAREFPLSASQQTIADADYPRFSDSEMTRRRTAVERLLQENDCDHLLFCGAQRFGSVVGWLTQWPVTTEAVGVFTPGERDTLYVQHVNHTPFATILAESATVAWGGSAHGSGIANAIADLERRGARENRVGVIGPISLEQHAALSARFGTVKFLGRGYTKLRQIKSAEELDWLRIGATLSDRGMAGLRDALRPGISERALANCIERAYTAAGGTPGIHYIGATPMHDPGIAVPRQYKSTRRIAAGDVVFSEITADFWGSSGQVLRSFTVNEDPTTLYRELHAAADAAFDSIAACLRDGTTPAQVVAASHVIEDSGFTVIDDLLHGYGGGYLPPVLGSASRPAAGPLPQEPFRAGMVVVIQPNIVTRDGKAGVQAGEMVLITDTGIERMHRFPRGFMRV